MHQVAQAAGLALDIPDSLPPLPPRADRLAHATAAHRQAPPVSGPEAAVGAGGPSPYAPPPMYNITASSLRMFAHEEPLDLRLACALLLQSGELRPARGERREERVERREERGERRGCLLDTYDAADE